MLLFVFILLCIPSSLALVGSIHDTKDTADLYPMLWQGDFHKNFVAFNVYYNYMTGEDSIVPSHSTRFGTGFSARLDHMHYGLYWGENKRYEDNYPNEEAIACAYNDLDEQLLYEKPEMFPYQSRIEVGQSRMSGNGTVRVHCSQFDGHVRRVSEACKFKFQCLDATTMEQSTRIMKNGRSQGNDSSLWKVMTCQRSENGYFENKLVGCLFDEIHNRVQYKLNEVSDPNYESKWKKCVESEPGFVKLEEFPDYEPVCTVKNVVFEDFYDDDVKGVQWECSHGRVKKNRCKIGKDYYVDDNSFEHKLPNGCKFICNPQTNIFKCDEALSMFKVEGKPRKMRKYKGPMFGLRYLHYFG